MTARSGRRTVRSLLLAGLTVALGIASVGLFLVPLGGGPPFPVAVALTLAPLLLAVAATASARARRASTVVFLAAADFAGLAVAVDLGLLLLLLVLGHQPVGRQHEVIDPALLGMLLVATLAGPLGRRAARFARTALAGTRRTPDELLDEVGRGAGGEDTPDLLRGLAEAMRHDWLLSRVQIWAPGDDVAGGGGTAVRRAAVVPAPLDDHPPGPEELDADDLAALGRIGVAGPRWLAEQRPGRFRVGGQALVAPVQHGGRVLALILVERPRTAVAFSAADERELAGVARRLGVVLHNRVLDETLRATLVDLRHSNAELQASRARLVNSGNTVRRRIERDLHDGAQQHLVALAVGLRVLRDGLPPDGPDRELLDELEQGARESIQALRDLAHGIYPPLLRDAGLAEALRAAAQRSPADVSVEGGPARQPEPIEAAVYFCCLEAIANAAKHAPGARVVVRLAATTDALTFAVGDDGPGFDPAAVPAGGGRQNMADRIGALGGTLEVSSAPGRGTTVAGRVPLGPGGRVGAPHTDGIAAGVR